MKRVSQYYEGSKGNKLLTIATLLLCVGFLVGSTLPVYAGMSFEERLGFLSLWPGGRIPVLISDHFTSDQQRLVIRPALGNWEANTRWAIQFSTPLATDTRYLFILPRSWFMKIRGEANPPTCGSWGPQPKGATYLWLTPPDCINPWSVTHEVGHAIGLGHEHLRPDRQFYMTIKASNPDPVENAPVGFFDYFSIMHSQPVLDVSTPRSSSVPLPWKTPSGPSNGDIDTVRALYAFEIRFNSDIVGGDYANFPLVPEATQRDCQLACAADIRCKAYTYAGTGVLPGNNRSPHCYLKGDGHAIPPFSDRVGLNIHSGKRKGDQPGSFGAARHVDLFGGQISGGVLTMPNNVLNGKNCKELCLSDPRCHAYTFAPGWNSGTCYMKSHNPDLPNEPQFKYVQHPGYLSGVVR